MKIIIIILPFLFSCTSIASDKFIPNGEIFYDILFSIQNLDLSKEPLCNVISVTRKNSKITLGEHLSTILSTSYNSTAKNTIKSSCLLSKHEDANKNIVAIWDCKLEVNETKVSGEFISASMIAFGINAKNMKYQSGTLRCL